MSTYLSSAIDTLVEQVGLVTPQRSPNEPFVAYHLNQAKKDQGLETVASGPSRIYDIVITALPVDDGAAAVSALRWRTEIAVRISYARGTVHPRNYLQSMVAEDISEIVGRLMNPSNWDGLIDTLIPGSPSTEILHDGARVLVSIPFTAIHY